MFDLSKQVHSGDTTNREGVAAKYYWEKLFSDFTRERYGDPPNHLLNFGYAILRSVVARALSSAGFHLALGIHHKNKYNACCLADDIMEPYRPYVDQMVLEWIQQQKVNEKLSREEKAYLLSLMQKDVVIDGKIRPLQVATSITAASLYRCIKGEQKVIRYPIFQ